AVRLRHVPGITRQPVGEEPELALLVLPVVGELLLQRGDLQRAVSRARVVEELPVDGTGNSAGTDEIAALEAAVNSEPVCLLLDALDLVRDHLRARAAQQPVVEFIAADGMLDRALPEFQPPPVELESLEREE